MNILAHAIPHVLQLCPEVTIDFTIHPVKQPTRWEPQDPNLAKHKLSKRGLIQTSHPKGVQVIANTINSSREFTAYIRDAMDVVSYLQNQPHIIDMAFTYNDEPIVVRVWAFNDFRYNGWVSLIGKPLPTDHVGGGHILLRR